MLPRTHTFRSGPLWLSGTLLAAAVMSGSTPSVSAQSGSRSPSGGRSDPPSQSYLTQPSFPMQPGSTTRSQPGSSSRTLSGSATQSGSSTQGTTVALSGYCPVSIIDVKQWVRGSSQYQVTYDGKVYYFPSADIRQTFLANPGRYVPALGGDCTVCFAKMGQRMPGSVFHSAYYQGRLYLFPGEDQKQVFVANPTEFADVDLAMNGLCAVCKVEVGQDVPGDPQFAAYHKGMRYLFPGEDQLKTFQADPQKYVPSADPQQPAPPAAGTPTSGLPTKTTSPVATTAGRGIVTVVGISGVRL